MQYLKSNGYTTKGGGKIFHGNNRPGDSLSWDFYFLFQKVTQEKLEETLTLPKVSTGAGWFNWGPIDVPDDQMQDVRTVNWAKVRIEKES